MSLLAVEAVWDGGSMRCVIGILMGTSIRKKGKIVMILPYGDKRRENFLKQGNLLWKLRNIGGAGNGLAAGGIVLLIFATLIAIPLIATDFAKGGIFFGCLLGVPGAILLLCGILSHRKRMKNYLSYNQEETGFDLEELERLEKELMEPDMFMIGNVPEGIGGYSEKKPQIACTIKRHSKAL